MELAICVAARYTRSSGIGCEIDRVDRPDDADDPVVSRAAEVEEFADSRTAWKLSPGQEAVHNYDALPIRTVTVVEHPALENGDLQRSKVVAADGFKLRVGRFFGGRQRTAGDLIRARGDRAAERHGGCHARRDDSGDFAQLRGEVLPERLLGYRIRVARARK